MAGRMRPTRQEYERLIDSYNAAGDDTRAGIAAQIESVFAVEGAILVLDLAGFTRLTAKRGIVFYLGMVRRMHLLAEELLPGHGGSVIKFEADNLFALFENVDAALAFALDMQTGFRAMNLLTEADADIHAAFGIAAGPVLLIDGRDAWGHAMNLASKLGEDLANGEEVLVAKDSFDLTAQGRWTGEPVRFTVSGLEIDAVRVTGRAGR